MTSEDCKEEIIYTPFCSVQNDWELSLSSLRTNIVESSSTDNKFWISLIEHNTDHNKRYHINKDNTLSPKITSNCKKENNLEWNIKLLPFTENKENTKHQTYYAEIECHQKQFERYHLVPSYKQITDIKASINCLDVAKSSYFKRWYICCGSQQGNITIYDVESSKIKMSCSGHKGHITQCAFFPFGDLILSGDTKGVLNIYAIANPKGEPAVSFSGHKADISCIDFIAEGSEIISGARDNTIRLWNCSSQKQVMQFGALGLSTINQISMINDKIIASVSSDGNFTFYDIKSGKQTVNIKGCDGDSIECFSMINSDTYGVMLGSDNGLCYVYDIRKMNENKVDCMSKIQRDKSCVKKIIKYKDNELIVCNSSGSIWKWNMNINEDMNVDKAITACDWTGNDQFGVNDVVVMNNDKDKNKLYVATKNNEIKEYLIV